VTAIASGWGRYPKANEIAQVAPTRPGGLASALERTLASTAGSVLPVGNRRSYGDSCLNDGNTVIDCRPASRILSYDPQTGILRAEPGILLREITARVLPDGWFLPVTPGTAFVTLGGAIANDVHGKNHHSAGSFGCHVRRFELARSDGSIRECSATENSEWFAATIGGLGLTGLMTWAEIQLERVPGPCIAQETIRYDNLEAFFDLASASVSQQPHTVSWMDSLAGGSRLGRGIFIRGQHCASREAPHRAARVGLSPIVPITPPLSLINRTTLRAFNTLYFNRHPRNPRKSVVGYDGFFYPLDRILHWNRLYGPQGLLQHQCVVPLDAAPTVFRSLLALTQASGHGSFLTVVKTFGDRASPGLMAFARPGATLTLDFANTGRGLLELLSRLDAIVLDAGGAINPYKDARMSTETFRRSFPQWEVFHAFVDPRFSSSFWRRVMESAEQPPAARTQPIGSTLA
jgi:FAD/FMN-containing dehydrogenase